LPLSKSLKPAKVTTPLVLPQGINPDALVEVSGNVMTTDFFQQQIREAAGEIKYNVEKLKIKDAPGWIIQDKEQKMPPTLIRDIQSMADALTKVKGIIDFTQANTIRTILGFNSQLVPAAPSTVVGENYESSVEAVFNRINFFYIRSSLVNNGLPINGVSGNIISQIPITAPPGSQINYSPQNVIAIEARNLIGVT